ncbi:MAG: enoyl-CoA hydratase/isomerase family protein [Alphaproteobacteria bacterium]|nr:enoyl-CoA hydratase/isomerase family protein [Alphaproteobacteria bacterium]
MGGVPDSPLLIDVADGVARVTLNRPARHNAFDEILIGKLHDAFLAISGDATVRAVVLAGSGPSFSAGADLEWMQRAASHGPEQNRADALALGRMLKALADLPMPAIARVHGSVFGGGVGLVAACDIAVAAEGSVFSLSEVRLGLVPAVISPYVIAAVGARAAGPLMLLGRRIGADEARRIGLIHEIVPPAGLDAAIAAVLGDLAQGGRRAQVEIKRLVRRVQGRGVDDDVLALTAASIAEARASEEGREGVAAFLAKRAPTWRS